MASVGDSKCFYQLVLLCTEAIGVMQAGDCDCSTAQHPQALLVMPAQAVCKRDQADTSHKQLT